LPDTEGPSPNQKSSNSTPVTTKLLCTWVSLSTHGSSFLSFKVFNILLADSSEFSLPIIQHTKGFLLSKSALSSLLSFCSKFLSPSLGTSPMKRKVTWLTVIFLVILDRKKRNYEKHIIQGKMLQKNKPVH
jgi:hypothetical protein